MRICRFHILLMMLGVFALVSCREEFPAGQQHVPEVSVHFQLQLSMPGAGGNSTKALEDELNGKPEENKIISLTLFVIDLDDNNELIWNSIKFANYHMHITATTPTFETIKIDTKLGKKYIYVGANMTVAQIQSFCDNRGVFTSQGTTYAQTIADFVDLNGRGITMFGQMVDETNSRIIEIKDDVNELNPIKTKIELSRVVSKVALTYDSSTDGYATIASGIGGSINAGNIWFMLNNTAKSIDFIKGMDTGFSRFLMSDYLKHNIDNPPYYYTGNPSGDFMFYTPAAIVHSEHNTHNVGKIGMPFELTDNPYRRGLNKYLGLDNGKHRHYESSLYCLESTVNTTGFAPAENILGVRRGINTEIVVAAKYTPGSIFHSDNISTSPGNVPITVADEDDMTSKTANDPNGAGTFYAVRSGESNMYDFYTYNAKKYLEDNPPDPEGLPQFITYKGGYGYYTTFISQPAGADIDDDENYNLYRNHYYILSVKEFTPPGAVYPQDVYMLVNSATTEWRTGKSTTVIAE